MRPATLALMFTLARLPYWDVGISIIQRSATIRRALRVPFLHPHEGSLRHRTFPPCSQTHRNSHVSVTEQAPTVYNSTELLGLVTTTSGGVTCAALPRLAHWRTGYRRQKITTRKFAECTQVELASLYTLWALETDATPTELAMLPFRRARHTHCMGRSRF